MGVTTGNLKVVGTPSTEVWDCTGNVDSDDDSTESTDSRAELAAGVVVDEHGNPKPKDAGVSPTEPVAETFWQTVCKVMPWAFGTALALVGGTLAITVVLPKLAALATAWGLTAKAMAAWGYVKAAFACLIHCAEYLFNMLISLQGQVLLGMFTFTADLGAIAGIVAGSVMTLIELTLVTLTLGVIGRSITNGICYLFGLNKAKDPEKDPCAEPDPEMALKAAPSAQRAEDGCKDGVIIPFPVPVAPVVAADVTDRAKFTP